VGPFFFDVVLSQRACRAFLPTPVPYELVAICLEAATHAPSAENKQPWVFVVIDTEDLRRKIQALNEKAWTNGAREHAKNRLTPKLLEDVERGVEAVAPLYIVVCGDKEKGLEVTFPSSIYPATQNLLLAASGVGLGSAMTTLALGSRGELQELLGLPDATMPMAVVPLGFPEQKMGPPKRIDFREVTHMNRYGLAFDTEKGNAQ
jgi:nitroreductase